MLCKFKPCLSQLSTDYSPTQDSFNSCFYLIYGLSMATICTVSILIFLIYYSTSNANQGLKLKIDTFYLCREVAA